MNIFKYVSSIHIYKTYLNTGTSLVGTGMYYGDIDVVTSIKLKSLTQEADAKINK